jgi:hydroxymethylglutaryl-CoA synthase
VTRGIVGAAAYLPHWRLDRATIAAVAGTGGGSGTRSVASYDEDTTTMAVEAGRRVLRHAAGAPGTLWHSTVAPAYLDKSTAATAHAALRLDGAVPALDAHGSIRSGIGALRAALEGTGTHLVLTSDLRSGLPGSGEEAHFGDGAAALLVGDGGDDDPVLAELVGAGSTTAELLDRWRSPGDAGSKVWEERFGETRYVALGERAWEEALKAGGLVADQVARVAVTGPHGRACTAVGRRVAGDGKLLGDLSETIGNTGCAHAALLLAAWLDEAPPGEVLALVSLADGADVLLFRATDAVQSPGARPGEPVAALAAAGAPVTYGTYLRWRGLLTVDPPRRPEPSRPSAPASARSGDWKYGFVGSRDDAGAVHLPPRHDDPDPVPMADATGTVATFTVDRLAYSPSPPTVFAVVDFDGGGRFPVELTDVDAAEIRVGDRVEMTFRRLFTADGVHNYFWKARPIGERGR